jgi:hypothetical protein
MTFTIEKNMTLEEIQQKFHAIFPFLSLAFFSQLHEKGHGTPIKYRINDHHLTLASLSELANQAEETVSVHPTLRVIDFELVFQRVFGVGIQVLRKSRMAWLEITKTDDWTIDKQNRKARDENETPLEMSIML